MSEQHPLDAPMTPIERVRLALAMGEAGYVAVPDPEDVAELLKAYDVLNSFDLTNHHNALKCPYCNPNGLSFAVSQQPSS